MNKTPKPSDIPKQAEEIGILEAQIDQLEAEIEKYKPIPLFLHGLGKLGFSVVINEDVPENQIWFATQKQLDEASSELLDMFEEE